MSATPELVGWKQENQEFKVILSCVVCWMLPWPTKDPVSKENLS